MILKSSVRCLPALCTLTKSMLPQGKSHKRCPFGGMVAAVVLFVCGSTIAAAQTTSIVNVPFGFSSIMQASDGNYYATYAGGSGSQQCDQAGITSCGGIYQIKPDGTVTEIYDFWVDIGQTPNDGSDPLNLVEGPDGYLYGATLLGGLGTYKNDTGNYGSNTYGTFFKIAKDGTNFTVLHYFTGAEAGVGGPIILGSDGNFYGANTADAFPPIRSIYKLSPTGQFTLLYQFISSDPLGNAPSGLVEGTDGNFYGTNPSYFVGPALYANGAIFQVTPSGTVTDIVTLPVDGSLGLNPSGALVEGPDGALYGTTRGASYTAASVPYATLFRTTMAGAFTTLHTFTSGVDGIFPVGAPPIAAADGNIYATAQSGGNSTVCSVFGGCGTLYGVSPTGTFTNLIQFAGGSSGAFPESLTANSAGGLTGIAAGYQHSQPTVYSSLLAGGTISPPIQISFYPINSTTATLNAPPNSSLMLQWNVSNAFSNTMRVCSAFRQDALDNTWTGVQTGVATASGFGGSVTITTPATAGSYTYALTCGGVESGFATLSIGGNVQIDSTVLPAATVSTPYGFTFTAHGGTKPYSWAVQATPKPPPGLSIDPMAGTFAGTPLQYGVYQVSATVYDSATPPLTNSVTLPLVISSGLALSSSLPNPVLSEAYSEGTEATGGLPPYTWQLISGQLPAGLTLNTSTGVIFGTPTKSGQSTFVITVNDNEGTPAKVTQTYTISTSVATFQVSGLTLPNCTVSTVCSVQAQATGGTTPYIWSLDSGSKLPPGLSIDTNGVISGKPLQFGFYQFILDAMDSETLAATSGDTNQMTISSGLNVQIPQLPDATVGVAYLSPAPVITGGLPPYTIVVQSPPGSVALQQFGATNGILGGTPTVPTLAGDPYQIYYTISDSEAKPSTSTGTVRDLTVLAATSPTATSLASSSSIAGTGMPVTFTAIIAGTTPSGMVTFFNGTNSLGTATVNTTGSAAFTTSFSSTGVYSITASYSGDSYNAASISAALTQPS